MLSLLAEKREQINVGIRREHKKSALHDRRLRIIQSIDQQGAQLDIPLTIQQLTNASRTGSTLQLFQLTQPLCLTLLRTPSYLAHQLLLSPQFLPLLTSTLSSLHHSKPCPLVTTTKSNLLSILSTLSSYPEMTEQMILDFNLVEIMGREIEQAKNDTLVKIVEFFAAVVILEQPFKQMWNLDILGRVLGRVGKMNVENGVQEAVVMYLYNFGTGGGGRLLDMHNDVQTKEVIVKVKQRQLMMAHAMRVIVFHYEYDEEILELALIVLTKMLESGTKYTYSYNPLIDILIRPQMDRKVLLGVLRVLEEMVYRSDDVAIEICQNTQFLNALAYFLHHPNQPIRKRSTHLLYNLCTIQPLNYLLTHFLPNLIQQLSIQDTQQCRNYLFKSLFEWCHQRGYPNLTPDNLRILVHLSYNKIPHQNHETECDFWLALLEMYNNIPVPEYIFQMEGEKVERMREIVNERYGSG